MNRIVTLVCCIGLVLLCGLFFFLQKDPVTTSVFEIENGFGYLIVSQDKILIKQENIPAIQLQKPFCSKEDALKTAQLVKDKIVKNQSPTVTVEELLNLDIRFNCVNL